LERVYGLYGLRIVADGEIPGLSTLGRGDCPEVRVYLNAAPNRFPRRGVLELYRSPDFNSAGKPNLTIERSQADGSLRFRYDGGSEFIISAGGLKVWCSVTTPLTFADALIQLRGPVMAMVLRMRGVVSLHASAIQIEESAVALSGYCGMGKSTTAAAFATLGYPVLTDDVAPLYWIEGEPWVASGYPQLNLWPDSVEPLFGESKPLPRLVPASPSLPDWDKRYFALSEPGRFQPKPLRLSAVYVLGERRSGSEALSIESLSQRDAHAVITRQTCVNYALDDAMRLHDFETIARLVRKVPVQIVAPHANSSAVHDLCRAIIRDHQKIASAPTGRARPSP
jgi:hypothetical protein